MAGFEAQFRKEVLKQVHQMIEANPELRKNRQVLALTAKITKTASKAAKEETIKEIFQRSAMERSAKMASPMNQSLQSGIAALGAAPGAMSQSYKVANVGALLQGGADPRLNETMDNGRPRHNTTIKPGAKLSSKQARKELERLQRRLHDAAQPAPDS